MFNEKVVEFQGIHAENLFGTKKIVVLNDIYHWKVFVSDTIINYKVFILLLKQLCHTNKTVWLNERDAGSCMSIWAYFSILRIILCLIKA